MAIAINRPVEISDKIDSVCHAICGNCYPRRRFWGKEVRSLCGLKTMAEARDGEKCVVCLELASSSVPCNVCNRVVR